MENQQWNYYIFRQKYKEILFVYTWHYVYSPELYGEKLVVRSKIICYKTKIKKFFGCRSCKNYTDLNSKGKDVNLGS